ncbi:nitroreductase family protein [Candidatus Pacearchaeota archaeon]|nr:nitroreductase family protein [Candidatus Pacearchaeota archaeon]
MDFDKIINKRHCARSFKDKRASWKDVMLAIDAANQGPFAGNMNHLKFLIVEYPETIEKIAKLSSQHWISESGILVVVCSDDTHLEKQYGERGRVYSRQQAGATIMTLILKLTDLGLDSCWVGEYKDELIRQILGIPEHIQVEAIIPIGYEKPVKGRTGKQKKLSLERSIFWEKWEGFRRPSAFEDPNVAHRDAY